jgi:hypothetical protein
MMTEVDIHQYLAHLQSNLLASLRDTSACCDNIMNLSGKSSTIDFMASGLEQTDCGISPHTP